MSKLNQSMQEKYKGDFFAEVLDNVEEGESMKMCMQCGVCSGSCPLGADWEHSPQKLFMMIRAGKREEVLTTDSYWNCTSCYNCIARCPRGVQITHIMHGLAHYSKKLGLAPKHQQTEMFSQLFWDNMMKKGRVNELKLGLSLYFMNGFSEGVKVTLQNQKLGLDMMKAKRMNPMEIMGGHGVKDLGNFKNMIAKAQELEDARISGTKV